MNYKITLILKKRFLAFGLLSMLSLLIFIVIIVFINALYHIKTSPLVFMVIFLLILSFGFFSSLKLSRRIINITLTDRNLEFDNINILLSDLEGYYINKEGLSMSEIELRDVNHNVFSLTSLANGKDGKEFDLFLSDLIQKSSKANIDIKELSYYDFHNKQYILIRSTIYFTFVIVVLLNLIYLFLIFIKEVPFNWKLLLVNFSLIWLYNFHKRNEKKYKKH